MAICVYLQTCCVQVTQGMTGIIAYKQLVRSGVSNESNNKMNEVTIAFSVVVGHIVCG